MFETRIKTHHSAMAEGKKYALGPCNASQVLSRLPADERKNATIYIHVPFCPKICSFCNMRRSLQSPVPNYHRWIVSEIEKYAALPYVRNTIFDAVYFGGGTPTMLSNEAFHEILRALFQNFKFTDTPEVTVETTVTELTEDKIDVLGINGVNRLSVGVQTFDDAGRRQMRRVGSGEKAWQKLKYLKVKGGFTVSMDLIYSYSGQSHESLKRDLDKINELELDGFSMYSLIDMKETEIERAQSLKMDESMFYQIAETMQEKGYSFLELTKMVKNDPYRYIMNRHQGADTLPLGAGAGGSLNSLLLMNDINLEKYHESVENFCSRKGMLFKPEYRDVTVFKGDIQTLWLPRNETLYSSHKKYENFLKRLLTEEYAYSTTGGYRLTTKGVFWGNTISRVLSDMMD